MLKVRRRKKSVNKKEHFRQLASSYLDGIVVKL